MNRVYGVATCVIVAGVAVASAWAEPRRVLVEDGVFEFWPDDERTFYTVVVPEQSDQRNGDLWILAHGTGAPIHVEQRQDDEAVNEFVWLAERFGYTVASVNYGDHRHQGWAIAAQADLTDAFARFVHETYALAGKTMVFGSSRGGWVATECLLRHPETFAGAIADGAPADIEEMRRYSRYLFRTELAVMDYGFMSTMMQNLSQGGVALEAPPVDRDSGQPAPLQIAHSPRLHADKLAGKLIFMLGDTDTRVPQFNLWTMFNALNRTQRRSRSVMVSYPAGGHHSPGSDGEVIARQLMLELARWVDGLPSILVPGRIYGAQHWSTLNVPDVEEFTEFPSPGRATDRNLLRLVAQRGCGTYPGGIANAFTIHDLDGDGSGELLYGDAEGYLHILKLDAGGLKETWRSASFGAPLFGLAIGDMGDDGRLEIAVADATARVAVLRAGSPEGMVWDFSDPLKQPMYNLDVTDIDHDGQTELVCGSSDGYVFSYDGKTHKIKARSPYLGCTFATLMAAVDTYGDGRLDLFTGDHAGYVRRLDGTTLEVTETSPYLPIFPWSGIVGDFTGSLGPELLVSGSAAWGEIDDSHTYVLETNLQSPHELPSVPAFFSAAVGNFDQDLFDEAVLGGIGQVLLLSAPSMATSVLFETDTDSVITGLAVGDMNGDGRPEVAAASREGNIWVIDPETKKVIGSREGMAGVYGITLIETGMGEQEIVVGTRDRHLKWLNAATLDTIQSATIPRWAHELRSADLTGDGFLDIIGTTGESFFGNPDGYAFLVDGLSKEVLSGSRKKCYGGPQNRKDESGVLHSVT